MAKLWQKDYTLDSLIESFTVGEDYLLDRALVPADCAASIAHATMLRSVGLLSEHELSALTLELRAIARDWREGSFIVHQSDEDCHTAIENRLTERLGDPGKKIHTGRSRNDQVIAALRLYTRDFLYTLSTALNGLISGLLGFARRNADVPMPGRTHMQVAMPSSLGLWAGAFAEELLAHLSMVPGLYALSNQSPLGSAASYGVPLPLDRELVARLLGFERVQNNVLFVNNSRGMVEGWILCGCEMIGVTLSRLAQDLILFSLPELGYFRLPDTLCSGSSIMPQKKNPDALELLRAKAATICSYGAQIRNILRALPSGYNRDVQETKAPFMRAARLTLQCVRVMELTVSELSVDRDRLTAAFTPEIFATDAALDLVVSGSSFRDAYRSVGSSLETLSARSAAESVNTRTYTGTSGNLNLVHAGEELERVLRCIRGPHETAQSRTSDLLADEKARFFS